ncbi:MAG: prephenate dehydratase [Candidatus Paceibacteria bacterium]
MIKIGVMGAVGSFSEQAGEHYRNQEGLFDSTIVPLVTADAVLGALAEKAIDKAIFPVMNNNGGLVIEAMHALAKYQCVIETIFAIDIHHMLLVAEGVTKDMVTTIVSHDQALKQCRGYLEREWIEAEVMPYKDTAAAAADLASGVLSKTTAVIASRRAGDVYGLSILASSIQDAQINKTTFLVAESIDK